MPILMLFGGLLLVGLRGWAFIYAHDHDPTPRADPMVHLLSHTAYDWLRYGGIALAAAGALLIVGSFVVHIRHTPQLRARHI